MNAVAIMVDDQGKVSVGQMPQEMMTELMGGGEGANEAPDQGQGQDQGEPGASSVMQPAQDVDSALAMAKQILAAPAGQQGPAAAPGGGQMVGKMSPADMAWNKVKADRQAMG
ncbi:MAG: hypothetical protein M0Z99_33920 [Betaproteobacteria bacterium]|nr:hypothetical protein [Betaproteobacteria bacterium]